MTMILIYLILIQQIYSAQSSKVNVINMSDWTVNSDVEETKHLSDQQEKKIIVGVLLPRHFPHPDDLAFFSRLDSVLPGVVLATQELQEVLPGWTWDILVGDTDCNSTTGPLQAVEMFYRHRYCTACSSPYLSTSPLLQAGPIPWSCVSLCSLTN